MKRGTFIDFLYKLNKDFSILSLVIAIETMVLKIDENVHDEI